MKIIYIAHPISGDVQGNLGKIVAIVKAVNLSDDAVVPLAPYFADILALDDSIPEQRSRGIKNDTAILSSGIISELWVYGNWRFSRGCLAEILLAEKLNIKVIYKV